MESIGPGGEFPLATYRLQFNKSFTFQDAKKITAYLSDLGISHCYASPLFQPRPGSTHGYDVCDFNRLNPELGSEKDFAAFHNSRKNSGLGLLLDTVPNHMGADLNNHWWFDVLKFGANSRFSQFFDIDWAPADASLRGKILLPVLGDELKNVLKRGELKLVQRRENFSINYFDKDFPLTPNSYPLAMKIVNGAKKGSGRKASLGLLLDAQHYHLAFWKTGAERMNYRRFFDVTELAGIKMVALRCSMQRINWFLN